MISVSTRCGVTIGEKFIPLTPQQAEIFKKLLASIDECVPEEVLCKPFSLMQLRVQISRIRAALEGQPYTIINTWHAYKLKGPQA